MHSLAQFCLLQSYNKYLAQYTAAWFKVYLDETPQDHGIDFENMLFGDSKNSLCGGGDGEMEACVLHR
jgi:hypothetical protein